MNPFSSDGPSFEGVLPPGGTLNRPEGPSAQGASPEGVLPQGGTFEGAEGPRVYAPSPTLARFHASSAFYRGVMGPVGSGKSTAMAMELLTRAAEQAPDDRGVRRSRFAVVRNTYRELKDTTIRTWLDWIPERAFGAFNVSAMEHRLRFALADGTRVEADVLFRALDTPQDVRKLLSLELTGAWVNEARELPLGVVSTLGDRVGRFPAKRDGGCTWEGVVMDTNPPDSDHWWYKRAEEDHPAGWEFFRQPGGLLSRGDGFVANPEAENLGNLPDDYYVKRMAGKGADHVRVYYCGEYGSVYDGRPVYPEFADAVHVAAAELSAAPGLVYVGIDFGLTPAAVFGQVDAAGRWRILDELVTEDMGQVRFAGLLKTKMLHDYAGHPFEVYGDPAGMQRAQTDERTPFDILRAAGIPARPAPTNDFTLRREAVASCLNRLVDGKPGLVVSPKCAVLRKGMNGAYAFKRLQVAGDERFHDAPDKSRWSHVCEAAQYMLVGGGEGRRVIRGPATAQRRQEKATGITYDPFGRF